MDVKGWRQWWKCRGYSQRGCSHGAGYTLVFIINHIKNVKFYKKKLRIWLPIFCKFTTYYETAKKNLQCFLKANILCRQLPELLLSCGITLSADRTWTWNNFSLTMWCTLWKWFIQPFLIQYLRVVPVQLSAIINEKSVWNFLLQQQYTAGDHAAWLKVINKISLK